MTPEGLSRLEELAKKANIMGGDYAEGISPDCVLDLLALAKWALQARADLNSMKACHNCAICKQHDCRATRRIPARRQVMSEKTFTVEAKVEVRIPSRPNWITINGKGVNTADCSIELLEKIGEQWTNTLIQEAEAKRRVGKSK